MARRLGLGIGISKERKVLNTSIGANAASLDYEAKAIAAGGSGGDAICAAQTFRVLDEILTPGFAQADTYTQLATAAGGTGGSTFCAQKTFSKLV